MIEKILDGRQRGANARIIGDAPLRVQRHIEIDAHQDALPGDIDIAYGLLIHSDVSLKPFLRDEMGQIGHAAGVTPFVVVPCDDLDHIADNHGGQAIDDRGMRVAPEIGRDQRLIGEIENAFERACSSLS